jgi:hypothetical protein
MAKYRSIPVEKEAFEWTEAVFYARTQNPGSRPQWFEDAIDKREVYFLEENGTRTLYIDSLEGAMPVFLGNFIIQGLEGELYPCRPDVFHKSYELAT